MGKLYLYYKKSGDTATLRYVKVKIDDQQTLQIDENKVGEIELPDGNHNIKMYCEGWTEEDLAGYIDTNILVNGDTYYICKAPKIMSKPIKLEKLNIASPDDFNKYVNKSNMTSKIIGIILLIIAILIILFLQ